MTVSAKTQQTPAKMGVRARERSALERITELEQNLVAFTQAVQTSFANNERNVGELLEVVTALVRRVGAEQVAETLKDIQAEKAQNEIEQAKANLAQKVEQGEYAPASVVTEDSVITGLERNADGTEVAPGYVQLEFATIKPEYQTKLLALKVGDKIETEAGRSFEITGVFAKQPVKAVEAPAQV